MQVQHNAWCGAGSETDRVRLGCGAGSETDRVRLGVVQVQGLRDLMACAPHKEGVAVDGCN